MEREQPWEIQQKMDGKQVVKFQTPDGRWASLVPDFYDVYQLFVEPFGKAHDDRLTPDQQADAVMNKPRRRGTSSRGIKLD